ncbi:hypothetical protein [Rhodococcus sp. Eu-32]|nr:hypothetical protein [Rhodococcus sp. Eu-32]
MNTWQEDVAHRIGAVPAIVASLFDPMARHPRSFGFLQARS